MIDKYPSDKDFTDLQLALFRAGEEGYSSVLVSGCWGGRFDHLWSVVHSAVWARERGTRVLAFADHDEVLFLLSGGEEWKINVTRRKGAVLSSFFREQSPSGNRKPQDLRFGRHPGGILRMGEKAGF